jgi:hypothetical protein
MYFYVGVCLLYSHTPTLSGFLHSSSLFLSFLSFICFFFLLLLFSSQKEVHAVTKGIKGKKSCPLPPQCSLCVVLSLQR